MTVVSRLELDHPSLGTAGGAGLHTSIEALYVKLGNNIGSRLFYIENFANAATSDLDHNFGTDILNLRYDIYLWDTGTQVLTRVTSQTSPALSAFPVIERPSFEDFQLRITNSSGAERDLVVAVFNDVVELFGGDVADVDTTVAAEDGQALVYDNVTKKWKPGASGDASFKISAVSDPNAGIKGGTIILEDGRELQTYDGTGGASTDYGTDLSINLDTVLGGNPANATGYYLYIDLNTLGAAVVLSDTLRTVYGVVLANFALLTTTPAQVDRDRYIEIGFIKSATSGTVWSGTGASFSTTGVRQGVRSTPDLLPENLSVNPLFERSISQGVTATTVTTAAETTSPLVGKQSLKLTSQASTGTVQLAIKTIPSGYLSKLPLSYSAMILTDANNTNGDWTIGIYNTTDSVYVAGPSSILGVSSMNTIAMSWVPQASKTYEARIARTVSTASHVLLVDKQQVSNDPLPRGAIKTALGDWSSLLSLSTTWGTVTNKQIKAYRDGGFLELKGDFKVGTPAGTANFLDLPAGYVIDTAQLHTVSDTRVGWYARKENTSNNVYSGNGGGAVYYDVSDANTARVELANSIDSGQTGTYANGNSLTNSGDWIEFEYRVPIVGWSETGYIVTPSQALAETDWVDNTVLGFVQTGAGTTRSVASASAKAFRDGNGVYSVLCELKTNSSVGSDTGTSYVSTTLTPSTGLHPCDYVTNQTLTTESFVGFVQNSSGFKFSAEGSSTSYGSASWGPKLIKLASKPTWWDTYVKPSPIMGVQNANASSAGLLEYYEDYTFNVDFTGAANAGMRIVRTGKLCVLTNTAALTFTSSNNPTSSAGLIPARFRPSRTKENVYHQETTRVASAQLTSAGTLSLNFFDWAGSAQAQTTPLGDVNLFWLVD